MAWVGLYLFVGALVAYADGHSTYEVCKGIWVKEGHEWPMPWWSRVGVIAFSVLTWPLTISAAIGQWVRGF